MGFNALVRARRTVYTILLITVRRRKGKKNRRGNPLVFPHSVELTRLSARSSLQKRLEMASIL